VLHLILAVGLAVLTPQSPPSQSPPAASAEETQAAGQAAVQGMAEIFTVMGSCERHFTAEQVRGVRRAIEPEAGQSQTPLQAYLDSAYQSGKANRAWTAPMCQEAMRMLAQGQARPQ
jgi:hypothetical protein